MPEPISAEANENSVESAETLQKPQLVDAETTEKTVDSVEPIEQSSEEPDVMSLLLGDDVEEPEDGKTVPEGQFLKQKQKLKSMKQELERLRNQVTQPAQVPQQEVQLQKVAEPPDPAKFDEGVYDLKYQEALTQYQTNEITRAVQAQMAQKQAELEANAYLSKYQERLDRVLPIANQRIEELKQKDTEFKQRLETPYFQQTLAALPAEAITAIAETNSPESIVNYYTHKPERLHDLSKNSVDELLNLGMLIGKVNGVKSTRKTTSTPIKPLKSGEDTKKLHPIKDHAKYDHKTEAGRKKWLQDYNKLNKGKK
jgi:hypothetical protein